MHIFLKVFVLTVFLGLTFQTQRVSAASPLVTPLSQFAACEGNAANLFGFPAWDSCLPHVNGEIIINDISQIWLIIIPLIESLIKLAAYVSVGFIIWGSIKFMKSQGNSSEVATARNIIRDAIIGLVIAISSVTIIQYIAGKF